MPAARQRSRSPFMAWAVMAMIGMWPPVAASRARIAAVASNPSISGICTSIRTTSNGWPSRAVERLAAVAGHDDLVAPLLQQADRQLLVDRVVLGQEEPERPPRARRRRRRPGRRRHGSSLGRTARATVMIASSRSDCLTASSGRRRRPAPGSGRRPRGGRPTTASSGSPRPAPASCRIRSARAKPSISGIMASSRTRANGSPAPARPVERRERLPAALDDRRLHAPVGEHLLEDQPVRRVVVHDQDAAGRAPAAGSAAAGRPPACAAGRSGR